MGDNTMRLCERVSYYDLAEAIHNEQSKDALKDIICADRIATIAGSAGFNMELCALERQEHEHLEFEHKRCAFERAMALLPPIEEEAKPIATDLAESTKLDHFQSLLADYKYAVEVKAKTEADAYYSTRLEQLKASWDLRVLGDKRAMIREAAIKLDLFPATMSSPATPKRQRTALLSKTATLAQASPAPSKLGDKRHTSAELTPTVAPTDCYSHTCCTCSPAHANPVGPPDSRCCIVHT